MFKTLKLTCDEATTICDKNQYGEASIKELIKLNIHLIKCRICGVYTKQNITLSNFYKRYAKRCKQLKHCMSEEDKETLRIALEENK
jgi:transcription elongation factor Elf1